MSSSSRSSLVTRISGWYARVTTFKVGHLFSQKSEPGPARTVFVHQKLPDECFDHKGAVRKEYVYNSNQVITSKYTAITFLPRNLLEQFRRIANVYFLALCILQFFPEFTTVAPGVVILPLLFIVGVTALKDGYEDYKRHEADQKVNYSKVRVLSSLPNPNQVHANSKTFVRRFIPGRSATALEKGGDDQDLENTWKPTYWEDLRVGDFVKIADNEPIPADVLICATSEEDNVAFVETKNLDGETNLKSRRAVECFANRFGTGDDCLDPQNSFSVRCDRPDTDMYRLNAVVSMDGQEAAVDAGMVLLRGTILRNTEWVIGVVLFMGMDTKIMLNSGDTPSKRSKVERQMNPQVLINLGILFGIAVICGVADSVLQQRYYPLDAPWLYGADQKGDNPKINGLTTWAFALLTFQDIVPISLYISIEAVRTLQAAFIYFDYDIWDRKTNTAALARSWNLSDDLGQIEYIFSDKTGTLTQNKMIFRKCSIGGVAYRGDSDSVETNTEEGDKGDVIMEKNAVIVEEEPLYDEKFGSQIQLESRRASSSTAASSSSSVHQSHSPEDLNHFYDYQLQYDLEAAVAAGESSVNAAHARNLNGFFTVLSLCHTVLAAVDPENPREVKYKAQSPDEACLVHAAADMGYQFRGRDREILYLKTPASPEIERWELLNILEFTSSRKRMSVVVRKIVDSGDSGDQEMNLPILLVKGADNVVFDRLKPGDSLSDALLQETEAHLSEFANTGLRTLTLAYKVVPEEEYNAWSERYHEATICMENREDRIEEVCDELERDLRLLGATAIEDLLQDGVPQTIADLKRAGIKIWVATGDKMETAIAIGRSTNLVSSDSNIIIIRGSSRRSVHDQMVSSFEQFFPEVECPILRVHKDAEPQLNRRASTSSRYSNRGESPIVPLRRTNTGVTSIVGLENGDRPGGFVLVVDGAALLEAFSNEENKSLLLQLSQQCEGVICCRVSPLQKALVVNLVKDGLGAMTLAIGDGANDVSMIQAADVGIGISGEEGVQAVNSSDYAIAQFRFLKKLILVHGHWSYARNGTMILNFFYKNIIAVGVKFWFQIYCGWSAAFVYDYIYVLFWNSLWTILPVIGIGLFDRIMDYHILMDVPELYHYGREGRWFSLRSFFVYLFDGIVQSAIIYFLIQYSFNTTSTRDDGYDIRQVEFGTTMAIANVMVANAFVGLNATAWTTWFAFSILFGTIVVWVFTIIYSLISPTYAVTQLYGNMHVLFNSAYFWLSIFITLLLSLLPRYIVKAWKFSFNPGDLEVLLGARAISPYQDWTRYSGKQESELAALKQSTSRTLSRLASRTSFPQHVDVKSASRTDMATGLVSVHRGFDFATEENGIQIQRIQTNISERRFGASQTAMHSLGNLDTLPQSGVADKGKGTLRRVLGSMGRIKRDSSTPSGLFSPTKQSNL
ncbi:phospholipid-translocating ATPase [Coprinopsis marcescibilis]|uniref:Phospholipid-transporting ATPase n=1 Tax=Coprinopsis marcescibilis TaxID=230819 RepID=A0A5C3KRE6_COPMA|nr:phospholipid-translocating ATPase [Coprinopsis marcescibilis]